MNKTYLIRRYYIAIPNNAELSQRNPSAGPERWYWTLQGVGACSQKVYLNYKKKGFRVLMRCRTILNKLFCDKMCFAFLPCEENGKFS